MASGGRRGEGRGGSEGDGEQSEERMKEREEGKESERGEEDRKRENIRCEGERDEEERDEEGEDGIEDGGTEGERKRLSHTPNITWRYHYVCSPPSEFLEAHSEPAVIVTVGGDRDVQEALGNGKRPLIDSGGDTALQQHLQQLGVCWSLSEALSESSDFVLHTQNGHLKGTQIQLRERGEGGRGEKTEERRKDMRREEKEGRGRRGEGKHKQVINLCHTSRLYMTHIHSTFTSVTDLL